MYAYGLSQSITGYAYYTPQPVLVYGIAASVSTIRWGCTGRPDEVHIADLYCDPLVHRMDSLQIWAILIEKRGDSFRRVDSVRWHYRSRPDIVWEATHDTNEVGIYACEFFFAHPLSVYDTFFVCMSVRGEAIEDDCTDADGSYHRMSVINNPVSCPGHVHVKYQYQSGMTNPNLSYFSGITTLYAHPIIVPPDTDAVGCQPPTLRFLTSVSGFPWFSYSLTTDEEAVGYEVQYAPVGSDTWDTATNFAMQDARFKIFADFDATRYYRVRFRSQHRHGCPIHDTTYWSPWSDTILFYTGSTAPDTTTSITPVEGCPDGLFTLSPNPATGTVTVTVGSLTHSSALAGTSPNLGEERLTRLGEQLILTLTDAAGREVMRKELSTFNSQLSTTLDLSGLAAGTYFVTLSTPTATSTQRLVVR